uniref:Myelin-associated glycoprotein n=1 Tax=Oreochromis niloticus TaxID=8128 RepID=A0A669CLE8_ORENI
MDTLEWLLFLCIYFKVTQIAELSWTADVPNEVKGLLGSCVVIPCSYNYPDPQGKAKSFTGIWMTTEGDRVIYHPTQSKIVKQYQSRTKLLGDASKNCSLMIEKLQQDDRGPFYFRIEIEGYNRASYRKNKVSISVMDEPNPIDFSVQEEVKEGQTVSAFCSVSHSCPTYPPDFHWSHPGVQHFQAQKLQNGQWNSTSTLTFCSNRTDHNKSLQCSVTYHEGKHQETSKTIKVKYAPDIKSSSKCFSERGKVMCECIVESRPPSMLHFVLGDRVVQNSKVQTVGSVTTGTLQTDFGSFKFVHCLANNTLGNANLTLSLPLVDNMQNIFIACGAGVIFLIVLIATGVGVVKKWKEDRKDMSCSDIYANDHVYGNTDCDESIYNNV